MIINKIRKKLSYIAYQPLLYDNNLKNSYMTTSVTGGQIKNKTVLISGSTGDIGQSLVLRFVDEGCKVILAGRNEKKLKNTINEIEAIRHDVDLSYVKFDLTNLESIQIALDKLFINENIDFYVCNAGYFDDIDRKGIFRNCPKEVFETSWKTNFIGNINTIDSVVLNMNKNKIKGSIVVISSICALQKKFQYTPYGMSKCALTEYSKKMSANNPNVSLNVISPGSVATKMGNYKMGSNISRNVNTLNRVILPEEIAALAAFLCSSVGAYMKNKEIIASACELF